MKKMNKLIGLLLIIFGTWVLSMGLVLAYFNEWTTTSGVFGDSFGAVNSLFSGLAFAGIIFTIILQKKELSLQRKELKQTRGEFKIQNETLKKQRFENTFFHLLNLHNEIVDKLYITRPEFIDHHNRAIIPADVTFNKRDFFTGAHEMLEHNGTSDLIAYYETDEDTINAIQEGYNTFNVEYSKYLSHYFRNLYHIFKYLYLTDLINESEKQFYANIIRAQLSNFELVFIFYNMLVPGLGYPKFKFLEQEYDILQNLDDVDLFNMEHIHLFYRMDVPDPFKMQTTS